MHKSENVNEFSQNLILKIKEKTGISSDSKLAKFLGINQPSLTGWRKNGVSELQLANAFISMRKQAIEEKAAAIKKAHADSIQPIVEFYPINKHGVEKMVVFEPKGTYQTCLRDVLKSTNSGIYVFYDTRGKALYTGKTKANLWGEMNLAFNRDRKGQDIVLVKHPVNNVAFQLASEKIRQPFNRNLRLTELAAYFSAYAVVDDMVDAVEGLLIRAFPNDTFNTKMEKIKQKAKNRKSDECITR